MNKGGIKELADILVLKRGLAATEAADFVETMFDVLNNGLHHEKYVKVKGLGTFKVIPVNARKSVDVNTGLAIEISGRDKITFAPDPALRDLVNRPFAQFETVVVNDGVDFTEIDERTIDTPVSETTIETKSTNLTTEPMKPTPTIVEEPQETGQQLEQHEEPIAETQPTIQQEPIAAIEEQPVAEPIAADEPAPAAPVAPQKPDTTNQAISQKWEDDIYKAQNDTLTKANDMLRDQLEHSRKMVRILSVALAICALLCCFGAYYMGRQFALRDNRILHLEAQMHLGDQVVSEDTIHAQSAEKPQAAQPSAAAKSTKAAEQKAAADVKAKQTTPQKVETKAVSPAEKAEPKPMRQYDADPRIRTGAYNIIGVAQTVTVKPGQTLSSISRAYLGPGMDCYVEAINGTKEVKAGQTIKIPQLKIKRK